MKLQLGITKDQYEKLSAGKKKGYFDAMHKALTKHFKVSDEEKRFWVKWDGSDDWGQDPEIVYEVAPDGIRFFVSDWYRTATELVPASPEEMFIVYPHSVANMVVDLVDRAHGDPYLDEVLKDVYREQKASLNNPIVEVLKDFFSSNTKQYVAHVMRGLKKFSAKPYGLYPQYKRIISTIGIK